MAIVIEKLSANNKQVKHYQFDQSTVSLGRGYENHIRLTDPYVCAEHALIKQDPDSHKIEIIDLDSINGMSVNGRKCDRAVVDKHDVVVLGKTRLRLFNSNNTVPPAIKLSAIETRLDILTHWRFALFMGLLYAATLVFESYQHTYTEFELGKALPRLFSEFILLSVWPLLFALLSRLQKQDVRLSSLFSVLWIIALLSEGLSEVNHWISFNFPQLPGWGVAEHLGLTLVFALLLWLTLLLAFHQAAAKRNRITLLCSLILLAGVVGWNQLKQGEFSPRPNYSFSLLYEDAAVTNGVDTEHYLKQLPDIYDKADRLRSKP
ncbi:FHA domain-containing protein [Lacimicrobium sp. SS2-24]|uniref:FHA domain-containing protein n=1 Tax=Lacimicrobium sp. SS2-24 TaxID=2005569 RepID=UPI000B4B103D|nr:FHA domain-containing protein [Lacimicrobium sp. SS2-24]